MIRQLIETITTGKRVTDTQPTSPEAMLTPYDLWLDEFDSPILPLPESKPRTSFDSGLPPEEQGMYNQPLVENLKMMPTMLKLVFNMRRSAQMYKYKMQPARSEASPEFITELEALACNMGANDIGYVKVPRNAIFKDKGIPCEYAIVYTVEMNKEPIDTSPSFASLLEVMRGYKNLGVIGNKMTKFMRKRGFAAYPGVSLGGLTDYPHLAELAGLGAIGYHGLLITPGEGSRLRINTIYTNITNLPTLDNIDRENKHLWVRDFCAMCKKCIRKCPVNAIFDEPKPRGDGGMQTIDHAACRDYFTKHYSCAICLAICPFSQIGYDKVYTRFKGNPDAPQFRIPVEGNLPDSHTAIP